jgi:hypothetical protein
MRRVLSLLAIASAAVLGGAGHATGEDEAPTRIRRPAEWRLWSPRWKHLQAKPGLMFFRRVLREADADPFPYLLAATDEQRALGEALPVTPETLGEFVTQASLAASAGAQEAVALFLPSEVVASREQARRIRAEARRLGPTLTEFQIHEHGAEAVEHYAGPRVTRRADGTFDVRLLALATELEVTLETVIGTVDPTTGRVTLERKALIQGPPCFWGMCGTGVDLAELHEQHARRLAERDLIRRTLRAALHPGRTREAARALARQGVTLADVTRALGEPQDDLGSGLHIWVFPLDQGVLLVGEAGGISWMDLAPAHPHSPFPAEGERERLWPPP